MWEAALKILENSMTQVVYDSMIRTLSPVSCHNDIFTIKTTKDFYKPTIKNRYSAEIQRCIRAVLGESVEVLIVSPENYDPSSQTEEERVSQYNYEKSNLRLKYTFDSFVSGKCNELAYVAAQVVSEAPGTSGYNPLFLYGGVGLGKTHLVHSIGNKAIDLYPDLKVLYVSSETFTNEFITSIRERSTQAFKDKFRECDLLLIDDVQFLSGKNETQEEMFHTFNDLYSENKQIVLTSDVPPRELRDLEARLTSRFSAGLIADITIPDYETRTAILEKKLHSEMIEIPQEVKEFITRNIVSNIRDLEGALTKVTAYARLTNTTITLDLTQEVLRDQLIAMDRQSVDMDFIQSVVAQYFQISKEDLKGKRRAHNLVYPRQIAMYLCRKMLDVSLPDVGKLFGGRDHTTVIHSCDKIAREVEHDKKLQTQVEELEVKIRGY